MENNYTDKDGNPIIDDEGGAMIQPIAGFVIKTRDDSGAKVFVNILHHDLIEPIMKQHIPAEEAAKASPDHTPVGIRIPLSLGTIKEDRDKKGDPVQCYDFIFNPQTVKDAQKDATFRQSMVEVCFGYVA